MTLVECHFFYLPTEFITQQNQMLCCHILNEMKTLIIKEQFQLKKQKTV